MKNILLSFGFLALAGLGTASAGSSTGDQTITFNMDKIQVLSVVDPATPLTMTWSNADWVPGQRLNSKYDPYWGNYESVSAPVFLSGGSISYSTNANSEIIVTTTKLPNYINHLHVNINNSNTPIYFTGVGSSGYSIAPGAGSLSLEYGALAMNTALVGNVGVTDTQTFTFTMQDQ